MTKLGIQKLLGVKKRRYKNCASRCYEISFRFVSDNQDWILIHGILDIADVLDRREEEYRQYHHAWAEKDQYVFDPAHNYFYFKKDFKKAFNAKMITRYSFLEASGLLLSTKKMHYGPWHE